MHFFKNKTFSYLLLDTVFNTLQNSIIIQHIAWSGIEEMR